MMRRLWHVSAWLGVIAAFVFSLDPASTEAPFMRHSDKLVHMSCYATLMFWWAQLYTGTRQRLKLALALIALGILIEYLQSFTPDRQSDVRDALANSGGVLLGWWIAHKGANLLALLAPARH
jgi:VanZ family protein